MYKRVSVAALVAAFTLASVAATAAEWPWPKRKPNKPEASPGASIMQVIGADTMVSIAYHRPAVKGRDVWNDNSDNPRIGALVPKDGQPFPWRAGANEATIFEVSSDVTIEGQKLPAGRYSLFMIPSAGKWTVIFNSTVEQWGSFNYGAGEDVLRVDVQAEECAPEEWLSYGFDNLTENSARAYLSWDKVRIPFTVSL